MAASTGYTLISPGGYGVVGQASAPFTVSLSPDNSDTIATVITPASTVGGTFNPTTVTLGVGTSSATFTFTPTGTGTSTISTTNSQSLTDPANITFSISSVTSSSPALVVSDPQALTANNTTAHVPIFSVTGVVEVQALWGIVTTALSSAVTVAFWRLNDQTAQIALTVATGTALSSAPVGSLIMKTGLAAAALTLKSSVAGAVLEPTTLETVVPSPIILVQKTAAVATNIEFTYTTTNTPATGAIQFFVQYIPLSPGAAVTPL